MSEGRKIKSFNSDEEETLEKEVRVAELLVQPGSPDTTLLDRLLTVVRAFEAGNPQSDDIAAIALMVET